MVDESEARSVKENIVGCFDADGNSRDDELLLDLQRLIFRYDVSILKDETQLSRALDQLDAISEKSRSIRAPHVHSFVRLRETQCMVDTARMMLEASLMRKESRMSHIRDDYPDRDDHEWLKWVLIEKKNGRPHLWTEPIATPLVALPQPADD